MKISCSYFENHLCRSCSLIKKDYQIQILGKEEKVISSLRLGKDFKLEETIRSPLSEFRNKAKMIVSGTIENPLIGLDQKELLSCPIHHNKINEALFFLKHFISLAKLTPFDIEKKGGELKAIILYYSPLSKEGYIRFVLRSKESLDRIKKHLSILQENCPEFPCITVNIQPKNMAILEGEEEIILTHKKDINHRIEDFHFSLSPQGFVQTNFFVSTELYKTAASWVKEISIKTFVEIFCGQGAFSFFCSEFVHEAIGFEINKSAVLQANITARKLQKNHLHFFHEDAKNLSQNIKDSKPDLLLVNPPRAGLQESIKVIQEHLPPYLIYSSCSIDSLAKDLNQLENFYEVKKVQLFDMFPHTEHFETLVLLKALKKT